MLGYAATGYFPAWSAGPRREFYGYHYPSPHKSRLRLPMPLSTAPRSTDAEPRENHPQEQCHLLGSWPELPISTLALIEQ